MGEDKELRSQWERRWTHRLLGVVRVSRSACSPLEHPSVQSAQSHYDNVGVRWNSETCPVSILHNGLPDSGEQDRAR